MEIPRLYSAGRYLVSEDALELWTKPATWCTHWKDRGTPCCCAHGVGFHHLEAEIIISNSSLIMPLLRPEASALKHVVNLFHLDDSDGIFNRRLPFGDTGVNACAFAMEDGGCALQRVEVGHRIFGLKGVGCLMFPFVLGNVGTFCDDYSGTHELAKVVVAMPDGRPVIYRDQRSRVTERGFTCIRPDESESAVDVGTLMKDHITAVVGYDNWKNISQVAHLRDSVGGALAPTAIPEYVEPWDFTTEGLINRLIRYEGSLEEELGHVEKGSDGGNGSPVLDG